MSTFQMVQEFHKKFGVPTSETPTFLRQDVFDYRFKFLHEELQEYMDACIEGDLVKAFDALIDLKYVLDGTADMMGLPMDLGFSVVHGANMQKVRVENATQSKRNHSFDVMKPEGWKSPEPVLAELLSARGWINDKS
jgi:predicted HAD superfamily Cof-like phosphohydrolase